MIPTIGERLDRARDLLNLLEAAMLSVQEAPNSSRIDIFINTEDMAGAVRRVTTELYDEIAWVSAVEKVRGLPAPTDDEREQETARRRKRLVTQALAD